jgi:hypothetical protein
MKLATPATTLDDLIRSTLDFARSSLGMEVGFVTEVRDGQRYFRHVATGAAFRPFDEGLVSPLPQTYCAYILNGTMACIVPDIAHHPQWISPPARPTWTSAPTLAYRSCCRTVRSSAPFAATAARRSRSWRRSTWR